jgi:quaternary ammonium compound-resistance protein SugE
MVWVTLIIAGLLEVVGAVALKFSDGFDRTGFTILTFVAFAASFFLLSSVVQTVSVGTAYAIWTGIGSAGVALFGMLWFNEPRNAARIAAFTLVIIGAVGMKVFS